MPNINNSCASPLRKFGHKQTQKKFDIIKQY